MSEPGSPPTAPGAERRDAFAPFTEAKFMSLTSFRADGSGVATPVWFALHGGRLLMRTDSTSFKVKRMRRNPSVSVAPCDGRGKVKGESVPGRAVELGPDDGQQIERLYWRRYPLGYGWEIVVLRPVHAALGVMGIGKRRGQPLFFEILPEAPTASPPADDR